MSSRKKAKQSAGLKRAAEAQPGTRLSDLLRGRPLARRPLATFSIAAALLVALLYGRLLSAPFVYDDLEQISANPALASWTAVFHRFILHPVALTSDLRGAGGSLYRPLFWLSLALDRHLWGLSAFGFHLSNLLLHFANGVLLFALLRRLRLDDRLDRLAAAASLLWLVLPIHVEVIAWISARSYSLATALLLLSLLSALGFRTPEGSPRPDLQPERGLAGSLRFGLFVLVACLANEIGVLTVPLSILLGIYSGAPRSRIVRTSAAGCLAVVAYLALRSALGASPLYAGGAWRSAGAVFWKYIAWMLLPLHLSVERSTSLPPDALTPGNLLGWMSLLVVVAVLFLAHRRTPLLAVGGLWIVLALLPFLGFTFIYQGMAERFVYPATIGLAIALAALACMVPRRLRVAALVLCALWAGWGAVRATARAADWTDPEALYEHSLQATPESALLWFNLGHTREQRGDLPGAEDAFRHTLQLRPGYPKLHVSLGDVYLAEKRWQDAQAMYAAQLLQTPADYATLENSAVALERAGDLAAAEQQDRRAIMVDPHQSAAWTNLGALLLDQHRSAEAEQALLSATAASPSDATPLFNLAVLYQQQGEREKALPLYRRVLALKPGDPDTLANMAAMR